MALSQLLVLTAIVSAPWLMAAPLQGPPPSLHGLLLRVSVSVSSSPLLTRRAATGLGQLHPGRPHLNLITPRFQIRSHSQALGLGLEHVFLMGEGEII